MNNQKYPPSEKRIEELENTYSYHPPKGDQHERYVILREAMKAVASLVEQSCPDSREKALAHTKLQEASMWANAAIARNEKY